MKINWITNIPVKAQDFLSFCKNSLKLPLEEGLKLFWINLKLTSMSDSPVYKFLERIPTGIKFDEIGKRKYLFTLSFFTLRKLVEEHLDLRIVKNLYLKLYKQFPREFFKGCNPKHSIISSQDIIVEFLEETEKKELPAYLKAKHIVLVFKISGNCEELISLLPELSFYVLQREKKEYHVWAPLSISEFVLFSLKLKEKTGLQEVENLFQQIKAIFPECFGEI